MMLFLLGFAVGLGVALVWHWFIFTSYDKWIVENGGTLPPADPGDDIEGP